MRDHHAIAADGNNVLRELSTALGALAADGLTQAELKEVTARFRLAETKLRQFRSECSEAVRQIQAATAVQREKVARSNAVAGIAGAFLGSKSRAVIARGAAADRRKVTSTVRSMAQPYRDLSAQLSAQLQDLARRRAEIGLVIATAQQPARSAESIATQTTRSQPLRGIASIPPGPAGPGVNPPRWANDPTGRNEYRYWDGSSWTNHVSNSGVVGTDSL